MKTQKTHLKSFLVVPSVKLPRFSTKLTEIFQDNNKIQMPDAVIIDLEDSVPPDQKETGRHLAHDFFHSPTFESINNACTWFIKVNDTLTDYITDDINLVKTFAHKGIGLALPKVGQIDEVQTVVSKSGIEPHLCLPTIETLKGFEQRDILLTNWSQLGVKQFVFGAGDMSYELDIERNYSLSVLNFIFVSLLISAKIHKVNFIDSPSRFIPSKDKACHAEVERECLDVFKNGGCGKIAIHPSQIAIINQIFHGTDYQHAASLVNLFESNTESRAHVDVLTGQYVGSPSYKQAKRTVATKQEDQNIEHG